MSRAVREALEDTDILPDPTVYDVTKWDDGYIHFRVEAGDINPGVGAGGDP